jgi:Ni2+-binding GTPase involved in maturation of urease and hydrogenase
MDRDAKIMRGDGPTVFTQVKNGVGVQDIIQHILAAYEAMLVQQKVTAATAAATSDIGHAAKKHKA